MSHFFYAAAFTRSRALGAWEVWLQSRLALPPHTSLPFSRDTRRDGLRSTPKISKNTNAVMRFQAGPLTTAGQLPHRCLRVRVLALGPARGVAPP